MRIRDGSSDVCSSDLHIHAVIANLSRLPEQFRNPDRVDENTGEVIRDDGWRAWHNGTMYKASATLTSMANVILREKIEALGYKTEITGKHGAFELLVPMGRRSTRKLSMASPSAVTT